MPTIKELQRKNMELRVRIKAINKNRRIHNGRVAELESELIAHSDRYHARLHALNEQVALLEGKCAKHVKAIENLDMIGAKRIATIADLDRELRDVRSQLAKEQQVSSALIALARRLP